MVATRVQISVTPQSDLMKEQKFHVGVKALIVNERNEILVLKANPKELKGGSQTHWDLPGGRIKEGSNIGNTLLAEVKEELGVGDIKIGELFDAVVSNIKIPDGEEKVGLLLLVYLCRLSPNQNKFKLSFEHTEYKWVNVQEAKELLSYKFPKNFIEKLDELGSSASLV